MSTGPQSRRFEHEPGVVLHALHWGEEQKRPLVLLHGGGANAHWWDHIAPSLTGWFHVVALDFRGHGESEYPAEITPGGFDADVDALLSELGRGDVVLVGHSMGAHVALRVAASRPEIRGLVLIDPSRGGSRRAGRSARLALALRRSYASRSEAVERFRFVPSSTHSSERLRRAIAHHSVGEQADGRFGYRFDPRWFGLPPRPRVETKHLRCPILLIRGAQSPLLSADAARAFVAELPGARLLEIAAAGHHVLLDRPDELIAALGAFAQSLPDAGGDA